MLINRCSIHHIFSPKKLLLLQAHHTTDCFYLKGATLPIYYDDDEDATFQITPYTNYTLLKKSLVFLDRETEAILMCPCVHEASKKEMILL